MRIVLHHPEPLLDSWVEVFDGEKNVFTGHYIDFADQLDYFVREYPGELTFENTQGGDKR